MRTVLIILLSLTPFISQAKDFYEAKIVLANGEVMEGLATLPSNESSKKQNIEFKVDNLEKPIRIEADDIYQITYTNENEEKFLFERNRFFSIFKNIKKDSGYRSIESEPFWLLVLYNSPAIKAYQVANKYFFNNDGVLVSEIIGLGWTELYLLLKRPDEPHPTSVGLETYGAKVIAQQKQFRGRASFYFRENAELVQRINDNEFRSEEIIELARAYSKYHETPQSENEE